jgi:hypothetical protein
MRPLRLSTRVHRSRWAVMRLTAALCARFILKLLTAAPVPDWQNQFASEANLEYQLAVEHGFSGGQRVLSGGLRQWQR